MTSSKRKLHLPLPESATPKMSCMKARIHESKHAVSHRKPTIEVRGCTSFKIHENVCHKNETSEIHSAYIDELCLESYYKIMGMPSEMPKKMVDDHRKLLI